MSELCELLNNYMNEIIFVVIDKILFYINIKIKIFCDMRRTDRGSIEFRCISLIFIILL